MNWTVETYGDVVDAELEALPRDMRRHLTRLFDVIKATGLQGLPAKSVKHLEDKLWELRITGQDGIARVIYVTLTGRRVMVLRAFIKKTQKTPAGDLAIARKRLANIVRDPSRSSSTNG